MSLYNYITEVVSIDLKKFNKIRESKIGQGIDKFEEVMIDKNDKNKIYKV